MFRSKTIATLRARNARLAEQRDYHRGIADTAKAVQRIIAAKFTDTHTLGWHEAGRLAEQVDGYQNLLTRHSRLLHACARYRSENRGLRRELVAQRREMTERLLVLEASNEALREVNEKHYTELAARAGASPQVGTQAVAA